MSNLSEYVALEVNGERVSLQDVVRLAKWRGQLAFVREAVDVALIRQAAEQRGIEVSDNELQQAADDFRAEHELFDEESTENYLAANYLTYEDWELLLEDDVITRKLRDALTDEKVEERFAVNRLSFGAATISRIVVKDEDLAKELWAQIVEDGADFHALARRYSVNEQTRPASGYVGVVKRKEMEPLVESAVFGAKPGEIVGPVKTDDGWELVKVESLHPATLNDDTREAIKSLLFEEWLDEQRRKARIAAPLLISGEEEEEDEEDEESEEE
jgi:putative peptide maturation system protein